MQVSNIVVSVSRTVVAGYRILATLVLGYYLVKETVRREKHGRKRTTDGGSSDTS